MLREIPVIDQKIHARMFDRDVALELIANRPKPRVGGRLMWRKRLAVLPDFDIHRRSSRRGHHQIHSGGGIFQSDFVLTVFGGFQIFDGGSPASTGVKAIFL